MGLHDFPLSALGGRGPPGSLGALSPEPWAAAAAAAATLQSPSAAASLASLSHALPGFLSHPQAAYASYLTSPSGYGLIGPMAAASAISSLAPTSTPSPMHLATPTTPPSSLMSPSSRLTPKESSDTSDGSNHPPPPPMLTMPPLPPPLPSSSATLSSDEEDQKKSASSSLFSSFLPIRHLRLRAQEHLEAAAKENGFDSSSSTAVATAAPPTGYQQS